MKKLLAYLGSAVIIGGSAPSVIATVYYDKKPLLNPIKNKIQNSTVVSAARAKNLENRALEHSELKPTGYFLQAGFTYKIDLNFSDVTIDFVIGQWGKYADLGIKDESKQFMRYPVAGKRTLITPQQSGMLYIGDSNQTALKIVNITSNNPTVVIKVPTFKLNETNQTEFMHLIRTTNSPFVEFISKHYFATMQTKMIRNEVLPMLQRSFNETLRHWDNVWIWTNEIYGLNENYSDFNQKHPHYIHIANGDDSVGYANAANGRIMFHNSTNAGKDLFLSGFDDQWGLWHETGHTYQTDQYKWNGLTEVTVNISALFIQEKLNYQLRIFKETEKQQWIKQYLSRPNYQKDFNNLPGDEGLWVKLGMFWQLHMAFGSNFYPLLSQQYRELNQDFGSEVRFNTDSKKQQEFIRLTSEIAGYNLAPFFNQWGLRPNAETENIISKYKTLTKPIWNNIADIRTEHNAIVQEKIKGSIRDITPKDVQLNFSEDYQNPNLIYKLFNIPRSINPNDLKIALDFEPIKNNDGYFTKIKLILNEQNGKQSSKIYIFKIAANGLNNTIMFENNDGKYVGMFGLEQKNHLIKFYGNSRKFLNSAIDRFNTNIIIKTNTGAILKDINICYNDSFNSLIEKYQLLEGIQYFDNYKITITEKNHIASWYIFDKTEYRSIYGTKQFVIWNNNLVEIL